jgi:predicted nucleic acid-binding protein
VIVVDTNVIAYLLLPGDQTEFARRLLLRDAAWCAPVLWRSELRNVLALYVRRGHVELHDAVAMLDAPETLLGDRSFEVPSDTVLGLAARSGRSTYDCEFVAVALALEIPLVTPDRQLLASFPKTAVALATFSE